ncbi:MAG: hypothetical protein G3M78_01590 [Candidatus Nitrohelix vancouverensis]|uniref:PilZ domain-containing protein n=1 Tax=Candidatus Nitrohelix vancouverensis TaxID=2705534 RepID=A0A7T0C0J6_9BACT|nr:MAG: hypothetical protein G3M78_01590 [Candidatus Nitrohelix vancouverensis]
MLQDIISSLDELPLEDLLKVKNHLDRLIKFEDQKSLGKRQVKRAKTKLTASLEIEREKEFFDQTHKIEITEMSVNGFVFSSAATVIDGDILQISFRHPATGEKKFIDCQAVRINENKEKTGSLYEVAAKIVDKAAVKAYRDMLKKRGKF